MPRVSLIYLYLLEWFRYFLLTLIVLIARNSVANSCYMHTHPFNSPFSGTIQVSRYQKGRTNLDFAEARDNE